MKTSSSFMLALSTPPAGGVRDAHHPAEPRTQRRVPSRSELK